MIRMGNGISTLNLASLNPDSMRETMTQQEIVKGLTKNRVRIAEIQEAHITPDKIYVVDNYRIITASPDMGETTGIVTGGAAIMIRGSIQRRIAKITRQSSRAPRVTPDRAESKMPIRIISTYAPNNGHTE